MNIASSAYSRRMTVAIVEHGPMGGTCLNRGCIPTKILTFPADIITQIQNSEKLNIHADVKSVDFPALMQRMRHETQSDSKAQGESVDAAPNLDWYKGTGEFIADYTMRVDKDEFKAPLIFIVAGARPFIPPIKGINDVDYLTSKTVLDLNEQPESVIIIGGGYIACELGHFFSAVGTKVTILGRNPYLVKAEDPDVSELLKKELSRRMTVLTNTAVEEVHKKGKSKIAVALDRENGSKREFEAETLLVAAGRIPNTDLLKPEKTGVKIDQRGYVIVDEYFRTSKEGIWAFGDVIGKHMFRHVANDESEITWYNVMQLKEGNEDRLTPFSYHAVPRAVFSYPQIATVGMTLKEASQTEKRLLVGQTDYTNTAKGLAMVDPVGFVRVIADVKTGQILGATVIGPYAPILIQEIVNLMYTRDRSYIPVLQAIHIHPALPEVVQRAVGSLAPYGWEPKGHTHEHHH